LEATANPAAAARDAPTPFAALVARAVATGASSIFVRLADVGPFARAFWRVALALPALYAWMRLADATDGAGSISREPRSWLAQSFELKPAGAFGIATGVFFGLYFLAVQAARKTVSAARLTFEATMITAAILFVVGFAAEKPMLPHTIRGVAALVTLAWISHC